MSALIGEHRFVDGHTFEIAYLGPREGAGMPRNGPGFYWRSDKDGVRGAFKTADEAYLDAMGVSELHRVDKNLNNWCDGK